MRYRIGCRLAYNTTSQTPFVFNIEAQTFSGQTVASENLTVTPILEPDRWTMPESGNRYFRINVPPGRLTVEYEAEVSATPILEDPESVIELSPAGLPLYVFPHLYPSRYCQSDRLQRFAISTFGTLAPGYARVNGICNWIRDYVSYQGGVSDALTSAFDTVTQRAGVCRDFAHLGIALCRTLGIPARYVSAYACGLTPPDFHAVFEAYLQGRQGGSWYLFDPTRLADPAGLVRVGIGRDAAEVAFSSAYGAMTYDKPEVWVEPLQPAAVATIQAVRSGDGG